jgi:citrate synthase
MTATSGKPAVVSGLEGVIATETRLSHVDGQAGELIIGGYALEEIAGRASLEGSRAPALAWPAPGSQGAQRAEVAARKSSARYRRQP